MNKLPIIDELFPHAFSSSWYNHPIKFEWERNKLDDFDFIILTDDSIYDIDKYNKKIYVWLIESPEIKPYAIRLVKENIDRIEKVFTFNKDLLEFSDKCILFPIGGCWIENENRFIHNKTKDISMIASNKRQTKGQKLRHSIVKSYYNKYNIDLYGTHYGFIENKIEGLCDYRFSIVVENCQADYYFSEKLIDCFQTGTIPLYYGCPSINKFFHLNEKFIFNDEIELEAILQKIQNKTIKYEDYIEDIKFNFEISKKYLVCDDLIYEYLKK